MSSGVRRACKRLGRTKQTVTQVCSPHDRLLESAGRIHDRLNRELPSPVPISPANAGRPHSVQLCGIADQELVPCLSSQLHPISPTLSSIHDESSGLCLPTITHITLANSSLLGRYVYVRSSTTMTSAWCRAFCRTARGNERGPSGLQSHYLFEDRYVRPGRERPSCRDAESEIHWFAVAVRMWLRGKMSSRGLRWSRRRAPRR